MSASTTINFGDVPVGPDHQPFIIAEMSGNHNGDIERAKDIVRAMADTGVQALKLQTYTADTITLDVDLPAFRLPSEHELWGGARLYDLYQEAHTPWEWHEPIFERARPAFQAIGSNIQYCGPAGNGAVAKLCHNLIGLASSHILAEGFTLAVKAGLDPELFLEVLRGGAYGKQIGLRHSIPEVIFKGDFDTPRFAFELARKDIGLATELAREYNVPMPMSNVAEQNMIEGINRGWGRRDTSAAFQLQEERAGVEVRTSS